MSEQPEPPEMSREQFDARLRSLNERRAAEEARTARQQPARGDWGMAVKLSSEFIAAVIVGGALGFGFDYLLGTSPWGLIVFFFLGFAAAVLNVLRSVGRAPASRLNIRALDEAAEPDRRDDGTPPTG